MTVTYSELEPHKDAKAALNIVNTGRENAQKARDMGVPVLSMDQLPGLAQDTRPVALIGMGQSLNQDSGDGQTLLDQVNARTDIIKVVAGSAHRMINDGRLTGVDYVVIGFAGDAMADAIEPRADITYIVAAQADPSIAAKIKAAGAKVFVFEAYVPQHFGTDSLGIGSTAATAALAVFANMGRKNFEFYGVDSSVNYADGSKALDASQMVVKAGHKDFIADKGFYEQQTLELEGFRYKHDDINLYFHGNSLHAALLNRPAQGNVRPVINRGPTP